MQRKGQGKRFPLNMRTTKEIREKLERAAAQSGRSLVQEVEHRLQKSFDHEETSASVSRQFSALKRELMIELHAQILEWFKATEPSVSRPVKSTTQAQAGRATSTEDKPK
jgi:hypothetical protein